MDPGASSDDLLIERSDEEFRQSYALGQSIGAGGAGEVFLATQVSLARQVVIKVMQRALVADETHRRRFHREARMLSRLSHPRITQVYEYGVWEGQPYLVMEYVDGGSLASLMERQPRVHTADALRIAMQTAEGLDYLHQNRILHRDIKPGNILLSVERDAKIADFGLARPDGECGLTAQGMVVGTLWYIAPEVLISEDASPQSDLFSLGMVTYQMLAGRMPFREDVPDAVQLASMRVNEPPLGLHVHRPDLPPEVNGLVNRLLSTDPAARPRSAGELVDELGELHDAIASPSRKVRRLPQPRSRPHPVREMHTAQLTMARPKVVESDSAPTAMRGLKAVTRLAAHTLPANRVWRWLAIGLALLVPLGVVAGLVAFRYRARPAIGHGSAFGAEQGTPLSITRSPRWVKARMMTVTPAKLVVRAKPVGEMTGQPIEAASKDPHEHDVDVAPLLPRVTYEIEARLVLPTGESQKLGTRIAESPLESLMTLAGEIERLRVLERLEQLDKARPRRQPPKVEQVLALIEPARFKARADALAPFVDEIWADPAVRPADRLRIYRGLEPLRYLDHYCEAHQVSASTGVERLLPPDLAWGTRPIGTPEPLRANALAGMVEGKMVQPLMPGDPASELLVDMGDIVDVKHRSGGQRAPDRIVKELVVGAMKPRRAQLKLVMRNVRSAAFTLTIEAVKEPIMFIAPYAKGLTGERVALYHTIPPEWVRPGTWKLTLQGRVIPGAYDNARPLGISSGIDDIKNYPQLEEIALLASE